MKRLLTMLVALLILNTTAIALAEVRVEDAANMPPPMVVTYDQPAVSKVVISAPVAAEPTIYHTEKEITTMPPIIRTPAPIATPAESSMGVRVNGDYRKGTVYGPNLSTRELNEVKTKVGDIISTCISADMTDREKIVALVNYVCNHCAYAPDWSRNRANTAWGLLVYGEAQCSGYARGMVALFDAVDVESRYVHAAKDDPINPSHQWNLVKLDGKWYHLDVQMLDSSFSGANKPIVLMGSHLTYDEGVYPQIAGDTLYLQ